MKGRDIIDIKHMTLYDKERGNLFYGSDKHTYDLLTTRSFAIVLPVSLHQI